MHRSILRFLPTIRAAAFRSALLLSIAAPLLAQTVEAEHPGTRALLAQLSASPFRSRLALTNRSVSCTATVNDTSPSVREYCR